MASDPLVDSAPTSRIVTFDWDIVDRLDRLGSFFSSEDLVLDDLWLVRGDDASFSVLDDFDLGASARGDLLDLISPSLFDRRLDDDLLTSVLIFMFAFFAVVLSEPFSFPSCSPTALPLREEDWSRPVSGGLGGAWWFSRAWLPLVLVFSLFSVKSVGSGVGMLAVRTSSLL